MMPTIPEAPPNTPINLPQLSPEIVSEPAQTAAKGAEAFLGEDLGWIAVENKMRRAQAHLNMVTAGNDIMADKETFIAQLAQTEKSEDVEPLVQKFLDNEPKAIEKKYGNDPMSYPYIQTHWEAQAAEIKTVATMRRIKLMEGENDVALTQTATGAISEYVQAGIVGDKDGQEMAIGKFDTALHSSVSAGLMTQGEADKRHQAFLVAAQSGQIEHDVASPDPAANARILKRLNTPGAFPNLTQIEVDRYKIHAEDALYRNQERNERLLNKAVVEHTMRAIMSAPSTRNSDGSINFENARSDADTRYKEGKLSEVQYEEIDKALNVHERNYKSIQADRQKKIIDEDMEKITHHQLSIEDVENQVGAQGLTRTQAEGIRRFLLYPDTPTEGRTFNFLYQRIQQGENVDSDVERAIGEGKLSRRDYKWLLQFQAESKEEKGITSDPDYKLSEQKISTALNDKVIEPEDFGSAVKDLRDSVKKNKLSGQQITDEANKIVDHYTRSWISKTLDKVMGFGETPKAEKSATIEKSTTKDEWMKRAKNSNKGVSDKELSDYYDKKYGNR